MNIAFFAVAALMLIAALAFVLPPLLRARSVAADPAAEARRKLKALDQARSDGILTDAEYAAKRRALAEAMLDTIDHKAPRSASPFYVALVLALVLPGAAIMLYRSLGEPRALDPAMVAAQAEVATAEHGPDMDAAISKLAEKMQQNPNDVEGWTLLGRAYKATQRFVEARDALKHAHDLASSDADVAVEYAEALALASADHRVQGESRELLDKTLKADPQNQRGLWLLGISESQAGHFDAAIAAWNRLLPLLPPNSDVAASIKQQIARAQATRDGKPPPAEDEKDIADASAAQSAATSDSASPSPPAAGAGPQITVKVSLDPKLKENVAPGDTLFIFAKAASGPPMPLAIQRLTAAQLPASVVLTDGMGMMPSMRLSQFPQVVIGARISKSGQAIAQSGDLQGLSPNVANSRTDPVELKIDQVVP